MSAQNPISATTLLPLMMQRLDAGMPRAPWSNEGVVTGTYYSAGADGFPLAVADPALVALRNMLAPLCKYAEYVQAIADAWGPGCAPDALAQAVLDAIRDAMPEQYAAWLAEVQHGA